MTTTTRKQKPYSDQNKRLNIPEDTWFQNFLNKYAPTLRSKYEVEKGLLAKQDKNDLDSMEGYRGDYGAWETPEDDIDSTYISSLLSHEREDDPLEEIPEELSYDTDDQWVQKFVDKEAEDYDTKMDDARENYLSNQYGSTSGGMTNNAFGSKKSGMSPVQQQAMVGLLKDFMSKAPDDPAPQVRGAGIIKGSGTPFPSLLAKKPERPRYVNKGLV